MSAGFSIVKEDRAPLPEGWTTERVPVIKVQIKTDRTPECIVTKSITYTYDENGLGVCAAYNGKRGTYCKKRPVSGSNRCYLHGGKIRPIN